MRVRYEARPITLAYHVQMDDLRASARPREDVGEAEKSRALLMEAAAVINIRRSNNEERRGGG